MTIYSNMPPPAASVAEAKAYLRIADEGEDAMIATLIAVATGLCEGFTGQALLARDVSETIPASGEWRRLGIAPVRSIDSVEGLPADGAAFAFAVDAYAIDIDANGEGWVRIIRQGSAGRASIGYSAGMAASWEMLPEPLRQGIIRLVAHLFTHRDGAEEGGPPAAVAALWRPWRRMRLS